MGDSGVVDKQVDLTISIYGSVDNPAGILFKGDVAVESVGSGDLRQLFCCLTECLLVMASVYDEIPAPVG